MTANPEKFWAILSGKFYFIRIWLKISQLTKVSNVEVLGIHFDGRLDFNLHIYLICKSTLKRYLDHEEKSFFQEVYTI